MAVNYLNVLGEYFPTAIASVSNAEDPCVYADLIWVTAPISEADLLVTYLIDYKTAKILELDELSQEDVINGFLSNALGIPAQYNSNAEDQLNLIGATASQADMYFSCKKSEAGYQIVDLGGSLIGASPTGLSDDATYYNAEIVIDGVSEYFSAMGQDIQNYTLLISALNADFSGAAIASLDNGNVKIESAEYSASSSIVISDVDLFSSFTTYISLQASVAGMDAGTAQKQYVWHTKEQMLQVLNDGKDVKLDVAQKFNVKKGQVLLATDTAGVDAIVW